MTTTVLAPPSVPSDQRDLLECPPVAALSTLMSDGSPQTSVVWCDRDRDLIRVNTMRGFAKERNMRRDPRVALLCYDPAHRSTAACVEGLVVDMSEAGAQKHLDEIASKYAGRRVSYFGDVVSVELRDTEMPVLCRIRPVSVARFDSRDLDPDTRPFALEVDTLSMPVSHLDLFTRDVGAVVTTLEPDGRPRSRLVDMEFLGRSSQLHIDRNAIGQPVAVLVVDPADTTRFIQLRGYAIPTPGKATRSWLAVRRLTLDAIHS